jgi:hypothetical protein
MNGKKASRTSVLLILLSAALAITVFMSTTQTAMAYLEPDNWTDPAIWLQDTNQTPGPGIPWYDDVSGPGQQQRELLYVGVDWDDTYVYVRWDVEALPEELTSVYYLLKIDAVAPFDPAEGTHALGVEIDEKGVINVTVRTPGHPKFPILWIDGPTEYTITSIPVEPSDPFYNRTAIEARYAWLNLTGSGPTDIWVMEAQTHANQGDQGWTSAVKDYLCINDNPVPWFSALMITMLLAVVGVAFMVKKKGALPVNKNLRT